MSMIHLSPAGSGLSPSLLTRPGGFVWWYLDLVDEKGDGLVVIWSFGLPFLPGYAASARAGQGQLPAQRPSLNIATYRQGALDFYLLQEYDPADVTWTADDDGDTWRFGSSLLTSHQRQDKRTVSLDLHLDLPRHGGLTRITVNGEGPPRRDLDGTSEPSLRQHAPLPDHDWTPLLAATTGRATITNNGAEHHIEGRLYHDRNGGQRPLHELGIDIWAWGRIALPQSELIYYVLDAKSTQGAPSEAIFLEILSDGTTVSRPEFRMDRGKLRRNLGGLRWWPRMQIERPGLTPLIIEHRDVVDSGPFYLRSLLHAFEPDGALIGRGVAEVCDPDRIDLAIHRPLVRMRVRHEQGDHSIWTPLFCGAREGRVRRLLASFLPLT
jgi:carotenoid 1,2-hydratase